VLASLPPPPLAERRQQVSPPLHRGEKQEDGTAGDGGREGEDRHGRKRGRKSRRSRQMLQRARSTRNDARWSCLVYPNLPSASDPAAARFTRVIFYPPASLADADDASRVEPSPKCERCTFVVLVPEIYASLAASSRRCVSLCACYHDKLPQ